MFDMLKTILLDIFASKPADRPIATGVVQVLEDEPMRFSVIDSGATHHTIYDTDGSLYGCGPGFSLDV